MKQQREHVHACQTLLALHARDVIPAQAARCRRWWGRRRRGASHMLTLTGMRSSSECRAYPIPYRDQDLAVAVS